MGFGLWFLPLLIVSLLCVSTGFFLYFQIFLCSFYYYHSYSPLLFCFLLWLLSWLRLLCCFLFFLLISLFFAALGLPYLIVLHLNAVPYCYSPETCLPFGGLSIGSCKCPTFGLLVHFLWPWLLSLQPFFWNWIAFILRHSWVDSYCFPVCLVDLTCWLVKLKPFLSLSTFRSSFQVCLVSLSLPHTRLLFFASSVHLRSVSSSIFVLRVVAPIRSCSVYCGGRNLSYTAGHISRRQITIHRSAIPFAILLAFHFLV